MPIVRPSRTSVLTRRSFSAATLAAVTHAQPRRPNFLVLFTDDQRFDTIRALGNREVQTPNMDRLVRRGVSFTHAFTMSGTHGAVCVPSRAQLMTGLTLWHAHANFIAKPDDTRFERRPYRAFPAELRKAGWQTFATGKWHNGPKLFNECFADGGNIFFGGMTDQNHAPVHPYDPGARYPKESSRTLHEFSSAAFATTAMDFLRRRDRAKPFLLYVAFTSPHDPRTPPERFARLYDPARVQLPPNFQPEHPFDIGVRDIRDELLAPYPRTPDVVRRHIADYYGMISEVDHNIGRILDALEASGEADNTFIVFAGDNGLAVGRHGLFGKQNLYEHSLRVPLVISGPGLPRGKRSLALCHIMDICPTILDLAGVPIPREIESRSLGPVLRDPQTRHRDAIVFGYANLQRGIRDERWKLLEYNVAGKRTTQLFDLKNDPWEMNNLAAAASGQPRIASMRERLKRELRAAGDIVDLDAAEWARMT
ncbi:MAG: sulfatase-like hydrolase/transferase [Bryobacteraceae bacterium]